MRDLRRVFLAVLVCVPAGAARGGDLAPVPAGAEFAVPVTTTGSQLAPVVAGTGDGEFVVVWSSASACGVCARLFDSEAAPSSGEIQVDPAGLEPAVAMNGNGEFVVVYRRKDGLFRRRYDSSGTPLEDAVPIATAGEPARPAAALDSSGQLVVVWESLSELAAQDVRAQRFDSSGVATGAELLVNQYTTNSQFHPAVSRAGDGGFVVVWQSYGQDGPQSVLSRRFGSSGTPLGEEAQAHVSTASPQGSAAVSHSPDGGFVVIWRDADAETLHGRRYQSTGMETGSEFQIPSAFAQGYHPVVGHDPTGSFVVLYAREMDGSSSGVFGRRFDSEGVALSTEFQVNATTADGQRDPSISVRSDGGFAAVWVSDRQDGDAEGVYGRRFELEPVLTPTVTPTATPTPVPPGVQFVQPESHPGLAVEASGQLLPDGKLFLCVVPNGTYPAGTLYTGLTVHCTSVTVSNGSVPPTVVWDSAELGSYDLLALRQDVDGSRIVAGDALGPQPGLVVVILVSSPGWGLPTLFLLLGGLVLSAGRTGRSKPLPGREGPFAEIQR